MLAEPQTKPQLFGEVATLRQQIADAIHDIKDPLGVILGYTGMLLQEASTSETGEWADALERINASALLINVLLTRCADL